MEIDQILKTVGFKKSNTRDAWFNRSSRKYFSHSVLRDPHHNAIWLESRLKEQVPEGEFWFYFNFAPATFESCKKILAEIDLAELTPVIKASIA
jgi:hypothetical protein